MPVNTTYDTLFPSKWLKATDIPDNKNLVLTVQDLTFEPVGQDREMRLVLHFGETPKKLICNKTNANTLQQLFGRDPNAATGHRIALYATPVSFAGQQTLGVRINPQLPASRPVAAAAQPPAPEPPEDDVFWVEPDGAPF